MGKGYYVVKNHLYFQSTAVRFKIGIPLNIFWERPTFINMKLWFYVCRHSITYADLWLLSFYHGSSIWNSNQSSPRHPANTRGRIVTDPLLIVQLVILKIVLFWEDVNLAKIVWILHQGSNNYLILLFPQLFYLNLQQRKYNVNLLILSVYHILVNYCLTTNNK